MFNPYALYRLGNQNSNNFITKLLSQYDWYIFLFLDYSNQDIISDLRNNLDLLAEHGRNKICIVDFTNPILEKSEYIFTRWLDDFPEGIKSNLIFNLQHEQNKIVETRTIDDIQKLLYSSIFQTDRFHPGILLYNIKKNWFTYRHLSDNPNTSVTNDILRVSEIILDKTLHFDKIFEISKVFYSKNHKIQMENTEFSKIELSFNEIFYNFFELLDDYFEALSDNRNEKKIDKLKIVGTRKFFRNYEKLESIIKTKSNRVIENILDGVINKGLRLERISLSNSKTIFRVRINKSFRLHFIGSLRDPLFVNIGPHSLSDYGYKID